MLHQTILTFPIRAGSCKKGNRERHREGVSSVSSLQSLRREYQRCSLDEADLRESPFSQFEAWFNDGLGAGLLEPNAMTLATVSADGRPSARIVLLKGHDDRGYSFFTNYDSRKSRELSERPFGALLFFWPEIERQVRIEGRVERASDAESDSYFKIRPRAAQLGAWASEQSSPLTSRQELEQALAEMTVRFGDSAIPRPPNWGGFLLIPDRFEFWQGRENRLHDRFEYLLEGRSWTRRRLAP
jgi:pyridoxamine 5'-phosphate oxidase